MENDSFAGWEPERSIKVVECDGIIRVLVKGQRYMSWQSGDEGCVRMAIAQLYDCGLGTQEDLAEAFGLHVNSVQRHITDFARHGMRGLISERSGPKTSWKITPQLRAKILMIVLREGVCGLEAIRHRLAEAWHEAVSLPSIRQVLRENGFAEQKVGSVDSGVVQGDLFDIEDDRQMFLSLDYDKDEEEIVGGSAKTKANRIGDNADDCDMKIRSRRNYSSAQRAYLDRLEQGDYNAYAGGLLFAPLLQRYEFLPAMKRVIRIATHEGYSFEELCLTLFYFDVFGFQSMEDFKRAYTEEFGLLIGRSKSPSHFTLRRFLHKVRQLGKSEELIDEFALAYLRYGAARWGVMYIDGHFLPYYGVYPITMGWHGVRKIPMKGSYNFLAVDENFTPWLFLIRSSSEDLLQKIPELIEKAKRIGEKAGVSRERLDNLIVLFDREGYSAELYRYLDGKDEGEGKRRAIFISWAKYADRWVNDLAEEQLDKTVCVTYEIKEPEEVRYFETKRPMNKYGKIRAIVIQSGRDKKRSAIFTNGKEEEIPAERVVQLMCRRWGEENLIKELMMKHGINYTPGYVTEEMDEQPLVDNPEVKELKKKRGGLVSELHRLKIELADHMLNRESERRKGKKMSKDEILESIVGIENDILLTDHEVDKLPPEIRFDEAHDGKMLQKLNYEKKRFLDCIKVFAYNMQAQMCCILLNHYDRKKEVLPALSMIVERTGFVKLEGGRLRVRLRRFKDREIDYAARHLCEDLNNMHPVTPDRFHFPIRYEVL